MRIGIFGLGFIMLAFCLIIINTGNIPNGKVDDAFLKIEKQLDENLYVFSQDSNLNNFVKYSAIGIAKEFHGTYYLGNWLNTWLPNWLVSNRENLLWLFILVICAPIIAVILKYSIFGIIILLLWFFDKKNEKFKTLGQSSVINKEDFK